MDDENATLAPAQYAKANGVRCPACESEDVESGSTEISIGDAYQTVWCNACDSRYVWQPESRQLP